MIEETGLDYRARISNKKLVEWRHLPKHSLFITNGGGVNIAIKTSANRFVYLQSQGNSPREQEVNSQNILVQPFQLEYTGA